VRLGKLTDLTPHRSTPGCASPGSVPPPHSATGINSCSVEAVMRVLVRERHSEDASVFGIVLCEMTLQEIKYP